MSIEIADGQYVGTLTHSDDNAPAPLIVCLHGSGCTSRYFDLRGNSWVDQAAKADFATLRVDRPGHGRSGAASTAPLIDASAVAGMRLLEAVWRTYPDAAERPVSLVGHSFGGAAAMVMAAALAEQGTPVAALCISGIGFEMGARYRNRDDGEPVGPGAEWLFGPVETYDWRGLAALRTAAAPWLAAEVRELREVWPTRWHGVASAITAPVHLRLAEYEQVWPATPETIAAMAASFTASEYVDSGIAPGGGHLYEVHRRGGELVGAQLEFLRRWAGEGSTTSVASA